MRSGIEREFLKAIQAIGKGSASLLTKAKLSITSQFLRRGQSIWYIPIISIIFMILRTARQTNEEGMNSTKIVYNFFLLVTSLIRNIWNEENVPDFYFCMMFLLDSDTHDNLKTEARWKFFLASLIQRTE